MFTVKRTIVIIHPGGLGDVLLAVPAMVRLRTRFPEHSLVLCADDQPAKLLLACRIIDAWISIQGKTCAELLLGTDSATGRLRSWLENCDLAIGWMQDRDGRLSETLKAVGAREVIVRSPFSTVIQATHQHDRFLEVINEAPSSHEGDARLIMTEPYLHLGRTGLGAEVLDIGRRLVVIHPGSGSIHKCVPPDTMAALVIALQASGATPLILVGPADREPAERLLQLCVNPPIVLKKLDILTVASLLTQTQLFVGQDSGITHLAALMGLHTVALFGPTNPNRWAPRGAHVTVVQGKPCFCQSWEEVSRCQNKPCLEVPQDQLVAVCLAHLNEVVIR